MPYWSNLLSLTLVGDFFSADTTPLAALFRCLVELDDVSLVGSSCLVSGMVTISFFSRLPIAVVSYYPLKP